MRVGPPRRVEEVVKGVELHGHQVLGGDAVGDLPRIAAIVGVEDAPVVAHDGRLRAGVGAARAEATLVVRHSEDDYLAQIRVRVRVRVRLGLGLGLG